jgi:preprotein translocase subunit YajC
MGTQKHELKVGEEFKLSILANDVDDGDILTFDDNTDLFKINPNTGEIKFKPKDSQIGTHRVTITLTDGNETVSKTIILEIKSKPDEMLATYYILLCPIGLILVILVFFIQERQKHKKESDAKKEDDKQSKDQVNNERGKVSKSDLEAKVAKIDENDEEDDAEDEIGSKNKKPKKPKKDY